jgi:tripartite-type tricarboxylate transporter receptor subunit TctC
MVSLTEILLPPFFTNKRIMKKVILSSLLALFATVSQAFTPPELIPVTIGYGPGAGNEVSFRAVAAVVEKTNPNVKFVITNKPGADEIVAANEFMKLPPDGKHLLIPSYGLMTTSEVFFPNLLQRDIMDLTLVSTIAKSPLAVIAKVDSKTNTPAELLARLKTTKEPINIALGVTGHALVYEYLVEKTNADRKLVQPVAYRKAIDAAQDVAGGHIEFGILPSALAYQLYKAGKVKYIGITGVERLPQIPEVPTWKESGLPGLVIHGHWIIALPPNTSPEIVDYYQKLFVPAINSKEAKEFFDNNLMLTFPAEQNPAGVRKFFVDFRNHWIPYAKKINLN